MADPTAVQNLYDALKTFVSSAPAGRTWYDVAKDFQPLLAATVALAAAIGGTLFAYRGARLAYGGAMARIDFDRDAVRRERDRQKLGSYLRLKSQLQRLEEDTCFKLSMVQIAVDLAPVPENIFVIPEFEWKTKYYALEGEFEELDQAWANIDLFSDTAARAIDRLRTQRAWISRFVTDAVKDSKIGKNDAELYVNDCYAIVLDARWLIEILENTRKTLKHLD
jgi:hypothetical protein